MFEQVQMSNVFRAIKLLTAVSWNLTHREAPFEFPSRPFLVKSGTVHAFQYTLHLQL